MEYLFDLGFSLEEINNIKSKYKGQRSIQINRETVYFFELIPTLFKISDTCICMLKPQKPTSDAIIISFSFPDNAVDFVIPPVTSKNP